MPEAQALRLVVEGRHGKKFDVPQILKRSGDQELDRLVLAFHCLPRAEGGIRPKVGSRSGGDLCDAKSWQDVTSGTECPESLLVRMLDEEGLKVLTQPGVSTHWP
jgi:hypothetical protein